MGKIIEPIKVVERDDAIGGTEISHPSFGLISFTRGQYSQQQSLFGSSIKHTNTITMRLSNAHKHRGLNYDSYSSAGENEIVEVEISAAQFAEMITSMNCGDGTPCTIRRIGNDFFEGVEEESKTEVHSREFAETLSKATVDIKKTRQEVFELLSKKKSLNKADRETVIRGMNRFVQFADSNTRYYLKSFNEQMQKTVTEAKAEVESFITGTVTKMGLESIWKQQNKLEE